ncbi:hypothetical protein CVT24_000912 [Panaeolus cyanescens]|uniref:Protein kinase domain-containing protein n=1 Tax=Panaeolus cyanescens TaxID=181874 RepID=A0A409YY38_9AGAR|nr:hypothetical protein CVT24_000912 [Panaeolus cyanescens]
MPTAPLTHEDTKHLLADALNMHIPKAFYTSYSGPRGNPKPMCPSSNADLRLIDEHISTEHVLQRVIHAPELTSDIQNLLDESIRTFAEQGHLFPGMTSSTSSPPSGDRTSGSPKPLKMPQPKPRDLECLEDIGNIYLTSIGRAALHIAPTLCLHPKNKTWNPMRFIHHDYDLSSFLLWLTLRVPAYNSEEEGATGSDIHDNIAGKFEGVVNEDEELSVIVVLPPTRLAEQFLDGAVVEEEKAFRWRLPSGVEGANELTEEFVRTYMGGSSRYPCDGSNSFGEKYWSKYQHEWEARGKTKAVQYKTELLRDLLIQRIWAKMVSIDATFCVINGGTKERIGIRHRESKSLFLSDIIEPSVEGYGGIHIGLYCMILKDAMERASRLREQDEDDLIVDAINCNSSAQKSSEDQFDEEVFNQALASKRILNLRFNVDTLRSNTPTSFLRISKSLTPHGQFPLSPQKLFDPSKRKWKSRHTENDVVEFVAQEWLGEGSTGSAYRGTAVLVIQSDQNSEEIGRRVVARGLVVKVSHRRQDSAACLRQEFDVYQKLAINGVRDGILGVHGLFQDPGSDGYALLMEDGDIDLKQREYERIPTGICGQVTMSDEEYHFLLAVVLSFNRIGLRHRDISPSNIFINNKGELFVADFSLSYWTDVSPTVQTRPSSNTGLQLRDEHISPDLVLKRVIRAPDMVSDLHNALEEALREFSTNGHLFPGMADGAEPPSFLPHQPQPKHLQRDDSLEEVSNLYLDSIGYAASQVAPALFLHPEHKAWNPMKMILSSYENAGIWTPFERYTTLCLPRYEQNATDGLPSHDEIAKKFKGVGSELAVLYVLPPIELAERFLDGAVGETKHFRWKFPAGVVGEKEINEEFVRTYMGGPSRIRRDYKNSFGERYWDKYRYVWEARTEPDYAQSEEDLLRDRLLQRLWAKMVSIDATFSIISCGTKERVAVRHRTSNSLFLSDVIDPESVEEYGGIHIGLYCMILKDALGRASHLKEEAENALTVDAIKPSAYVENSQNQQDHLDDEAFNEALASKRILNLRFNFGTLRSQTPTSFLRITKSLTPSEMFDNHPTHFDTSNSKWRTIHTQVDIVEFVAQKWLGYGNTGSAYRGTAVLWIKAEESEALKTVSRKLVLKVSHRDKDCRANLKSEASVYQKLAAEGIRDGILGVHGPFKAPKNYGYALLMQDGGISLQLREHRRTRTSCEQVKMSDEEYYFLLGVLMSFKRIGLRHCDINPVNILTNSKGALFVADFSILDWKGVHLRQDIKNLWDIYNKTFKYGKYGFKEKT